MGRTSLILVVGFNIIFITMGLNISSISSHAYNSYIKQVWPIHSMQCPAH